MAGTWYDLLFFLLALVEREAENDSGHASDFAISIHTVV